MASGRVWRGKGGKGGCRESYCGEGTVTGKRESDDKDARGDNTEHSGTGRWGWRSWERVEEVSTLK